MTASSITFLFPSAQALCAQLQNQIDDKPKTLSRPGESGSVLPAGRKKSTAVVFIITNRKRRNGTPQSGFSALRSEIPSYFTATTSDAGKFSTGLSANTKFDQQEKEEFFASL
jgi:hypothetical protein